jgi:hypothetical protein
MPDLNSHLFLLVYLNQLKKNLFSTARNFLINLVLANKGHWLHQNYFGILVRDCLSELLLLKMLIWDYGFGKA